MANSVTQEQIDSLIKESDIEVKTMYDKVTVVSCKLPNGFVITESSGAVSKENYSEEIGKECCMERIKNKLWELEGYKLSCELNDSSRTKKKSKVAMISQPMTGLTDAEITSARQEAISYLVSHGYAVLNTYHPEYKEAVDKASPNTNVPLMFLAKSLDAMSKVDLVYFCKGWSKSRGCRLEKQAAREYGLDIICNGN